MIKSNNSNNFMAMLFAVSIGFSLVLSTIFSIMYARGSGDALDIPVWAMLLVGQTLAFGVPSAIYLAIHRDKIKELLPLRWIGVKNILMITGMTIAILPMFALLNMLSQLIFPPVIVEVVGGISQEGGLLLMLFIVGIVPSVFEEVAYRGIGFAGFKHVSLRKAAIVNGLFFGMIHMNMNQFLYAFILGAVFCYFVYYTKSIWAPFLAHFVFNGINVLIMHIPVPEPYAYGAYPLVDDFNYIIAYAMLIFIALLFAAAFVAIYIAFKRHNIKRNERDGIVTDTLAAYRAGGYQVQEQGQEQEQIQGQGREPGAFTLSFKVTIAIFAILMLMNYLLPVLEQNLGLAVAL